MSAKRLQDEVSSNLSSSEHNEPRISTDSDRGCGSGRGRAGTSKSLSGLAKRGVALFTSPSAVAGAGPAAGRSIRRVVQAVYSPSPSRTGSQHNECRAASPSTASDASSAHLSDVSARKQNWLREQRIEDPVPQGNKSDPLSALMANCSERCRMAQDLLSSDGQGNMDRVVINALQKELADGNAERDLIEEVAKHNEAMKSAWSKQCMSLQDDLRAARQESEQLRQLLRNTCAEAEEDKNWAVDQVRSSLQEDIINLREQLTGDTQMRLQNASLQSEVVRLRNELRVAKELFTERETTTTAQGDEIRRLTRELAFEHNSADEKGKLVLQLRNQLLQLGDINTKLSGHIQAMHEQLLMKVIGRRWDLLQTRHAFRSWAAGKRFKACLSVLEVRIAYRHYLANMRCGFSLFRNEINLGYEMKDKLAAFRRRSVRNLLRHFLHVWAFMESFSDFPEVKNVRNAAADWGLSLNRLNSDANAVGMPIIEFKDSNPGSLSLHEDQSLLEIQTLKERALLVDTQLEETGAMANESKQEKAGVVTLLAEKAAMVTELYNYVKVLKSVSHGLQEENTLLESQFKGNAETISGLEASNRRLESDLLFLRQEKELVDSELAHCMPVTQALTDSNNSLQAELLKLQQQLFEMGAELAEKTQSHQSSEIMLNQHEQKLSSLDCSLAEKALIIAQLTDSNTDLESLSHDLQEQLQRLKTELVEKNEILNALQDSSNATVIVLEGQKTRLVAELAKNVLTVGQLTDANKGLISASLSVQEHMLRLEKELELKDAQLSSHVEFDTTEQSSTIQGLADSKRVLSDEVLILKNTLKEVSAELAGFITEFLEGLDCLTVECQTTHQVWLDQRDELEDKISRAEMKLKMLQHHSGHENHMQSDKEIQVNEVCTDTSSNTNKEKELLVAQVMHWRSQAENAKQRFGLSLSAENDAKQKLTEQIEWLARNLEEERQHKIAVAQADEPREMLASISEQIVEIASEVAEGLDTVKLLYDDWNILHVEVQQTPHLPACADETFFSHQLSQQTMHGCVECCLRLKSRVFMGWNAHLRRQAFIRRRATAEDTSNMSGQRPNIRRRAVASPQQHFDEDRPRNFASHINHMTSAALEPGTSSSDAVGEKSESPAARHAAEDDIDLIEEDCIALWRGCWRRDMQFVQSACHGLVAAMQGATERSVSPAGQDDPHVSVIDGVEPGMLGLAVNECLVVIDIVRFSPVYECGRVRVGDVLVEVDGAVLSSPQDGTENAAALLAGSAGSVVYLVFERNGVRRSVRLMRCLRGEVLERLAVRENLQLIGRFVREASEHLRSGERRHVQKQIDLEEQVGALKARTMDFQRRAALSITEKEALKSKLKRAAKCAKARGIGLGMVDSEVCELEGAIEFAENVVDMWTGSNKGAQIVNEGEQVCSKNGGAARESEKMMVYSEGRVDKGVCDAMGRPESGRDHYVMHTAGSTNRRSNHDVSGHVVVDRATTCVLKLARRIERVVVTCEGVLSHTRKWDGRDLADALAWLDDHVTILEKHVQHKRGMSGNTRWPCFWNCSQLMVVGFVGGYAAGQGGLFGQDLFEFGTGRRSYIAGVF